MTEEDCLVEPLECPFKWKLQNCKETKNKNIINELMGKKEQYLKEGDDCEWFLIVLDLILCYEHCNVGQQDIALMYLNECGARLVADRKDELPSFMATYWNALYHVVISTRYYVERDPALLAKLTPREKMSLATLAGLDGIRGAVCMEYGQRGQKQARYYLERATKKAPETAAWHFLLGQTLSRIRHVCEISLEPDVETGLLELEHLEKAVKLSNNSYQKLFLAQTLQELPKLLRHTRLKTWDQLEDMTVRAKKLYMEVLIQRPDCAYTAVRCGRAFSKFIRPHCNMKLAYSCVERAIAIAPDNTMINHRWGQINVLVGNLELAEKHLLIAADGGAYGAYMDLLRMRSRKSDFYDPAPVLQQMKEVFLEEPQRSEIKMHMAICSIYLHKDFSRAVQIIVEVLELDDIDDKHKLLQRHWPCLAWVSQRNLNVLHVLEKEARKNPALDLDPAYRRLLELAEQRYPELSRRGDGASVASSWRRPASTVALDSRPPSVSGWSEHEFKRPDTRMSHDSQGRSSVARSYDRKPAEASRSWSNSQPRSSEPKPGTSWRSNVSGAYLGPESRRPSTSDSAASDWEEKGSVKSVGQDPAVRKKSDSERPRLNTDYMKRFMPGLLGIAPRKQGSDKSESSEEPAIAPRGESEKISLDVQTELEEEGASEGFKDAPVFPVEESIPSRRDKHFKPYSELYGLEPAEETSYSPTLRLKLDSRFIKERLPLMLEPPPRPKSPPPKVEPPEEVMEFPEEPIYSSVTRPVVDGNFLKNQLPAFLPTTPKPEEMEVQEFPEELIHSSVIGPVLDGNFLKNRLPTFLPTAPRPEEMAVEEISPPVYVKPPSRLFPYPFADDPPTPSLPGPPPGFPLLETQSGFSPVTAPPGFPPLEVQEYFFPQYTGQRINLSRLLAYQNVGNSSTPSLQASSVGLDLIRQYADDSDDELDAADLGLSMSELCLGASALGLDQGAGEDRVKPVNGWAHGVCNDGSGDSSSNGEADDRRRSIFRQWYLAGGGYKGEGEYYSD